MPVSRLRLRFSAAFALVLAAILGLFVSAGLWQQWRESHRRLDERLIGLAAAVDHAIGRERAERPAAGFAEVAGAVARRWPHPDDGFAVLDSGSRPIAVLDPRGLAQRALAAARAKASGAARVSEIERFDLPRDDDDALALRQGSILVFDSTEDIERDSEALAATLLVAIPVLILLALVGGYLLAGWALRPMGSLGEAIDALAPDDSTARLLLPRQQDEVFALAERVNTLLARVEAVRQRHQRFVREAAHQIRTPLTLVLGEAEHALDPGRQSTGEAATALARVLVAAEQMRRRVDELMLFAEADSGATFELNDRVELDELAFECTDLMRRRAATLGRRLALIDLPAVTVRGNAALLREALLEVLENACRHGGAAAPVTMGIEVHEGSAQVVVTSALPDAEDGAASGNGLGVPILDWIAMGHGGRFVRSTDGGVHKARLVLPRD